MKLGPKPGRNTAVHNCTGDVHAHDAKSIVCGKFLASCTSYSSFFGLSSLLQEEIGPNVLMCDISNAGTNAFLHGSRLYIYRLRITPSRVLVNNPARRLRWQNPHHLKNGGHRKNRCGTGHQAESGRAGGRAAHSDHHETESVRPGGRGSTVQVTVPGNSDQGASAAARDFR